MRQWSLWRRPRPTEQDEAPPSAAASGGTRWRALPAPLRWLLLALLAATLWYGVLGGFRAGIHYDFSIRPTAEQRPAGGSATLGLVARLIEQQVDERPFVANDPFFAPTALARRTGAFQSAVIATLANAAQAMAQTGNSDNMIEAAAELAAPPTQWWLSGRWPLLRRPAEWHYRRAATEIGQVNRDLADSRLGQGSFVANREDRDRLLRALLARLAAETARGDRLIRAPGDADAGGEDSIGVQIARARGTAYATTILLRGLAEDNAAIIRESGRAARWSEALDALDQLARLDPWLSRQQHLVQAGYSLLMAENAIRSILEG